MSGGEEGRLRNEDRGQDGASSEVPVIEVSENGPYVVTGLRELRVRRGEYLPLESVSYLCRCGGSKSKPFCDSTHIAQCFSGEPMAADEGEFSDYQGSSLTIHDNRAVCSHVGYCVRGAPAVFDKDRRPWIKPDEGDAAEVVKQTIQRCPSGALAYTENGERHHEWERDPGVGVARNGPYKVVGGAHLRGQMKVQPTVAEHYALCRCGASGRKPYCDGTHLEIGFTDE